MKKLEIRNQFENHTEIYQYILKSAAQEYPNRISVNFYNRWEIEYFLIQNPNYQWGGENYLVLVSDHPSNPSPSLRIQTHWGFFWHQNR